MNNCRLLLERVARLYERYEAGRRKPFNVFSVLRRDSDEVNLHSRFLHALLDYRAPEAERENLKDFLDDVANKKEFKEEGAKVKRECDNIDILITNAVKQAISIENKIWARDQSKQLQNYHDTLKSHYDDISLLYLTLDGHEPSRDSVGDLDRKTISCISYKNDLLPWLERCQKRAYDRPELRESIAQYRQLVRKLTGTDLTGAYKMELKELLLQKNNFVLTRNLINAMTEVHIELLEKLWGEIESELGKTIPDLPDKANRDSDISPERIRSYLRHENSSMPYGLYYPFVDSGAAALGVGVDANIYFGVRCSKRKYKEKYNKLGEALKGVIGDTPDGDWPWCKYANEDLDLKNPTQENFEMLSNKEKRREYVKGIAHGLKKVWKTVKDAGFAG